MIGEVVYTEACKFTLTALITGVENSYGTPFAEKLLNRNDGIVKKIIKTLISIRPFRLIITTGEL